MSIGPSHVPGNRLDADAVKSGLRDPDAFARGLGLIAAETAKKPKHNKTRCPYCGKQTLSIWLPADEVVDGKLVRKTVIGTCQMGCKPAGFKTYSPLDLIARIKGWAMSGADFQKVLELADLIGGGIATAPVPTPPEAPQAAPPARAAAEASPAAPAAAKAAPAAPAEPPQEEEPDWIRLHPDRTPKEWSFVLSLGVDPHVVRGRPWLWVLRAEDDQPNRYRGLVDAGFTLWLDGDIDGNITEVCAVNPGTGEWRGQKGVLLTEFGQDVLEGGPDRVSAWPAADQGAPTLYLALGPVDFLRAEPALQRALQPLLGILGGRLPREVRARLPSRKRAKRVLLHHGVPTDEHLALAQKLSAELRPLGAPPAPARRPIVVLDAATQGEMVGELMRPGGHA